MVLKSQQAVKVRGLEIFPPVALAPMVGLSHSALRSLLAEAGGVGLFYTEMLSARRLPHDNAEISPLLIRSEAEKPLIYQLITAEVERIKAAVDTLHVIGADGIDLNLGCPAPAQRRQGAGSFLAANTAHLLLVLRELRRFTELPLSVKIRLGRNGDVPALRSFCSMLVQEGVDMITVHARLEGEKFCRKPKWSIVGEIRESVQIPLFVNGGIFSVDDAKKCLQQSGADGIMVGRGAVRQPWLCADISSVLYGAAVPLGCKDKTLLFWRFVELLEERFPPERRLGRLKEFSSYFCSSFEFGHHFGTAIQSSGSIEEAKLKAHEFFYRESD